MPKYTMDMILEYSRVFPENYDEGDLDGGKKAKAIYDKGGQYVTNAYFTSKDQIDRLLADGLDPMPMGYPRIKEGNEGYGIGKYMQLARPVLDNTKTFENKNGTVEVNYGGPVKVVNLTEGEENKSWWTYGDNGPLGNGTAAKVQFETYSQGAGVRLMAIGVTEHVPYDDNYEPDPDDHLFDVES